MKRKINILLVEDNPGDVLLTSEALKDSTFLHELTVAKDGEVALNMLLRKNEYKNFPLPDLILLDINLPKINGKEVLTIIKQDEQLRIIPVIMLTTSEDEMDINESYLQYANCYITKPVEIDKFLSIIPTIEHFWLSISKLPFPKK